MKPFAIVFPGQGSQSVGMLNGWEGHPVVNKTVEEASDALGMDLGALMANGPEESLALTTNTQPVMLTAGIAAYRVWLDEGGVAPAVVAGHSLGEYAALVAAEALNFADAVRLVRLRAQAMQDAVPVGVGAMAAVLGLDAENVVAVCQEVVQSSGEVVEAVNFNDLSQTVIAGSKAGVDLACEKAKEAGAKRAIVLPVSAPFHSSLMKPAAERLKEALSEVQVTAPKIPVLHNIDVATRESPDEIRNALYQQAYGPVRWVETMQALKGKGISQVIECGSGKVLVGLLRRIDKELVGHSVIDLATLSQAKEGLTE